MQLIEDMLALKEIEHLLQGEKLSWLKVLCAIVRSHKTRRQDLMNAGLEGTWVWGQWDTHVAIHGV
jgi:hypothetical protein